MRENRSRIGQAPAYGARTMSTTLPFGIGVGSRVYVEHEGEGVVTHVDPYSVEVRILRDGMVVSAAPQQIRYLR